MSAPTNKSPRPPIEVYELVLEAPKGFRPSDWPERLMNWDESAELGEDLIYTKYVREEKALIVRADLVDPESDRYTDRFAVWTSIMNFARDNKFGFVIDPRLEEADPRIHATVLKLLREHGIKWRLLPAEAAETEPTLPAPAAAANRNVVAIPEPHDVQRALAETVSKITPLGSDFALIGEMALSAHGIDRYPNDVDLAATVRLSAAIETGLANLDPRPLKIGGVSIMTSTGMRVDLIDLRFEYRLLFEEAIREAKAKGPVIRTAGGDLPVVPLPYLAAMKLIADRPHDELDLRIILALEKLDYGTTREVVHRHVGPYAARRLDKAAKAAGRKDVADS